MPSKQYEKDIQNSILRLLKKHNIYCWRNNVGVAVIQGRVMRFGKAGSSDIFCFHKGRFVAIEVKTDRGKLTKAQKEFLDTVNKQKYCLGFVARSKEDVIKHLNLE